MKVGNARDRYVAIAARRFAERGFDGASLALIAKDAGVSRQALLHFFSTKEKLYAEVLQALAKRLSAQIKAITEQAPEARLVAYFNALAQDALARPDDARLVIRALLESDPNARIWPLEAYLDELTDLALETRRWRGATRDQALCGLYQLLGAIQYFAISGRTFAGMRGEPSKNAMADAFLASVDQSARSFAGAGQAGA